MRERSTLVLSLALLGALAAGSYWLAEQARLSDVAARARQHEPDYYVDRFALTRMDQTGHGRYTLHAERVLHFPDDDSTQLSQPRLVSLAPDRPRVNLRADLAQVSSDGVEVQLIGAVELRRAASDGGPPFVLRTPRLLVLPEEDKARTDQAVAMEHGATRIAGRGLEFDNGRRRVELNPKQVAGVRVTSSFAPRQGKGATPPAPLPEPASATPPPRPAAQSATRSAPRPARAQPRKRARSPARQRSPSPGEA